MSTLTVSLRINGRAIQVPAGCSVAAALRLADRLPGASLATMGMARRSASGEARAPFCGMGICQECRVDIDGQRRLACQTRCAEGMTVETAST